MKALGLILKSKLFFAPAFLFLSLNLCVGTWAVSIPQIKEKIGFSESELGIAILCFGMGTFVMLFLTPKLIQAYSLARVCIFSVIGVCLCMVFPFLAFDYIILCVSLFVLGLFTGLIDIAMNTLVSQIEEEFSVNIMSANHGFFSLGGVASGGLGALCLSQFERVPLWYVIALSVLLIVLNLFLYKYYKPIDVVKSKSKSFDFSYLKPLFLLLLIGFICMGAEGAVADWSALYLKDISKAEPLWYAVGFLSFSIFMTLGRFLGDYFSDKFGSFKVLYIGLSVSLFGYVAVLLKYTMWSILGFGLIGFGLSVVIPELFRISGQYRHLEKSRAISLVAGAGYVGFLIGPVLYGFIAEATDLWWSFLSMFIVVFAVLVMVFFGRKNTA
jgi:MFS family permease